MLLPHITQKNHHDNFNFVIGSIIGAIMLILVVFVLTSVSHAGERVYSAIEVCDAIYRAEGGAKAKYYYGIRSVHYKDIAEAQRICLRTVRHAMKDYKEEGRKGDFIEFLGNRYCPTSGKLSKAERKVNQFWVNNVKYFLNNH